MGMLSRTQKILLTVAFSAMFVPVMFIAPILCVAGTGSLLWHLSYFLPGVLVMPTGIALALLGFGVPCGFFAWLIAIIWIRS